MITYLTYDLALRSETNPDAIATLLRKGWIEAPQPPYDPETQSCDWINGQWVVSPIVIPVPDQVQMWALREAVMRDGQLDEVNGAIDALPEPDRSIARNRWDYKPFIKRHDEIIHRLQIELGWSDDYINDLYKSAQTISSS